MEQKNIRIFLAQHLMGGDSGRPALFEIVSTRDFGYSEQNKVTPKTIRASTTGGKALLVVGYIVKGRRRAGNS